MIPIYIDTNDVVREFSLTKSETENLLDVVIKNLTSIVYVNWQNAAKQALFSTKNEYTRSLRVIDSGKMTGMIKLTNFLPNAVESGMTPFDMKGNFLKSSKVHYTKDGDPYITIPFRFASSGALGESSVFSAVLPDDVYKKAKNLQQRDSMTIKNLPAEFQDKGQRERIVLQSKTFDTYKHKSAQFEGLTKLGDKGHSHYSTFRRVSLNSDPNSWIHTGIQAFNLADRALSNTNIEEVLTKQIDKYIDSIIG